MKFKVTLTIKILLTINLFLTSLVFAQAKPSIVKLSLVRADNGKVIIDDIADFQTVQPSKLPTTKVNILATADTKSIRRIEFITNNNEKFSDYTVPYSYKGDDGGNLNTWVPKLGTYTIKVIPYDKESQKAGNPRTYVLAFEETPSIPSTPATPTPTIVAATPSPTPSMLPAPTKTPLPSPSKTQTPSPTASIEPSPSSTTTPSATPIIISTPTPTPVPPTPVPTETPAPSPEKPKGPLKIFPGASGFGTETTAGSGRNQTPPSSQIFRVDTLKETGRGSLNECIEANGPRVCIFEVSGKINLSEAIEIKNPYLTIAGQTAPYPGIILTGAGIQIKTHDVLLQHLRIRVGDDKNGPAPAQRDGLVIWGTTSRPAYNVVVDRISVTWAIDENISTYGDFVNNITVSNSLIAEALYDSIHPKGAHGMGLLVGEGTQNISINNNLFAHNHDRNPRINPGTSVEFISNFVYNWGGRSGWNVANISDTKNVGSAVLFNFIGNEFKMGPDSTKVASITGKPANKNSRIYVLDNLGPTRKNSNSDEWDITSLSEKPFRSSSPTFTLSNTLPTPSNEAALFNLTNAGARVKEDNYVDNRIKNEAYSGTGRIKDCLNGCSKKVGKLDPDTSIKRVLVTPTNPHDDDNSDGYTNLENWLHGFYEDVQ